MEMPGWLKDYRAHKRDGKYGADGHPQVSRDPEDVRETSLLRDVAFNRHSMNDGEHVSPLDNDMVQIGTDGIVVKLIQGVDEESFKRNLSMATRATVGIDLSKPMYGEWEICEPNGPDETYICSHTNHDFIDGSLQGQVGGEDWEEMMKGGLQSVLESQVIVFVVSGVSRACTHQLVRTRKAAFHQQSQRATYYGDYPEVRMPESVWRNPKARMTFLRAAEAARTAYRVACEEDISYQDARYALPEGTTNYIMCEYSVREFINTFAYRGCSMFNWEIVAVMREMRRLLVEAHPWLEPHVKISCEKTGTVTVTLEKGRGTFPDRTQTVKHHCTFQGWESVEGQCDFPWAKEEARTFKPIFYTIGRRKDA